MSTENYLDEVESASVSQFLRVKAYATERKAEVEKLLKEEENSENFANKNVYGKFPIDDLNTDKMLEHILECASALSHIYQLQKRRREIIDEETVDSSDEDSVDPEEEFLAAKRKTFKFALNNALAGYMDDDLIVSDAAEAILSQFPRHDDQHSEERNWLPLHWAVAGVDTLGEDTVKLIYKHNPDLLLQFHCNGHEGFGTDPIDGYTPLHVLCMSVEPNLKLLEYFAEVAPSSFKISADRDLDSGVELVDGYYPLHVAAEHACSVESIEFLLKIWPSSANKMANTWKHRYPLDTLMSSFCYLDKSFDSVFERLLQATNSPMAVGYTICEILNIISTDIDDDDDIDDEDDSDEEDKKSHMTGKQYMFSLLERLLKEYPSTAPQFRDITRNHWFRAADRKNCSLLHVAAATRLATDKDNEKAIKLIYNTAPEHVHSRTQEGSLPVHVAAKAGNLVALKFLLEFAPETALIKNGESETVLHIAVHCYASIPLFIKLDMIRYLANNFPKLQDSEDERQIQRQRQRQGQNDDDEDDEDQYVTPYMQALEMGDPVESFEICRLLLRARPHQDRVRLYDLNWEARKMAMFVGISDPLGGTSGHMGQEKECQENIIAKLRVKNEDLFRYVVSFL